MLLFVCCLKEEKKIEEEGKGEMQEKFPVCSHEMQDELKEENTVAFAESIIHNLQVFPLISFERRKLKWTKKEKF